MVGPLMFFISVALAAQDIATLGLSWHWWAAIGGVIFFASGFAIIWGQQKEIGKLQEQIDSQQQGKGLLERLERLEDVWTTIFNRQPANDSELEQWKMEYTQWKDKAILYTEYEPQTRYIDYKRRSYNEEHRSLLLEGDVIWDKIRVMINRLKSEL